MGVSTYSVLSKYIRLRGLCQGEIFHSDRRIVRFYVLWNLGCAVSARIGCKDRPMPPIMVPMHSISRSEWTFPLLLVLFFAIVGSVPYGYGYATAGADEQFMGFIGRGTPGANSYLAFARQTAEGHTRVSNLYTTDAPARAYFNPEWWIMGAAARTTGLSLITLFHTGRVLSVLAFVLAAYYLCAVFLPGVATRRVALTLICFGAGFGWVLAAANAALGTHLPLPLDAQGVTLFGYCMNKPHFIRAACFAALQYAWLIRGDQTGRPGFFAASGLAAAGHSLIRPYHIPEACLVLVLYFLVRVYRDRSDVGRSAQHVLVAGLCHAPAIAWHAWLFWKNPLGLGPMVAWQPVLLGSQVLWLGLPFAAILAHLVYTTLRGQRWTPEFSIPVLWLVAAMLLLQAHPWFPFGTESYFAWVLVPPLLLLRHTWPAIARQFTHRGIDLGRRRVAVALVAVVAIFPSNGLVYAHFFTQLQHPPEPWRYYLSRDVIDGVAWLEQHAPEEAVVLASHATSQFVPRLADLRVVTGQDVLTRDYPQMNAHVARFFQSPGDDGFKRWFCQEQRVAYVIVGPDERALGPWEPTAHTWLHLVFETGGVTIFQVIK